MIEYPPAPQENIDLYLKAFEKFAKDNDCDLATLAKAYDYNRYEDGYTIAKYLDSFCGWDINSEWVEKLDDLSWLADAEYKSQRKQWMIDNNIKPSLEIGTTITKGRIVGICEYNPGYYLVDQGKPNSKLLVKFEDAKI